MKKPLPVPTPDTRPFWNGLGEGRVMLRHCRDCDTVFHYPRIVCPGCLSSNLDWRPARGTGTLYTYTVSRRPTHPLFADEVPQILAVVELDEQPGLWVMTNIVGCEPASVFIGQRVRAQFEAHDDVWLPLFTPEDAT